MLQQLPPHLSQRTHRPWPPQTVQLIKLGLHLFQWLSCWIFPFVGTPPVGCPFTGFIVGPIQKKWDHSSSGALGDQCNKQTHVDSQEVEVSSEHSSTKVDEDMPKWALKARPMFEPQGQVPTSPTKATTDPGHGTVVGTLRSTGDQDSASNANYSGASSNLDSSREIVANSDIESTSVDCFTCLDTDEVTIRTA